LTFTSATQGWFITKLKWYETILLLLITLSMFRPDAIMNRIYPQFSEYEGSLNEDINFEQGRDIRLQVTRYTNYGERYKLFAFEVEEDINTSIEKFVGIATELNDRGNLDVVNLEFMGVAEQRGLFFYDEITSVQIGNLDRPNKEWVYLFGFILLCFVIFNQNKRKKILSSI